MVLFKIVEVICVRSFIDYFIKNVFNFNELIGVFVGGFDCNDNFEDWCYIGNYEELCIYINFVVIGVLVRLVFF